MARRRRPTRPGSPRPWACHARPGRSGASRRGGPGGSRATSRCWPCESEACRSRRSAQELGVARRTIHRWLAAGSVSEHTPRRRPPRPLAPFAPYLTCRWAEGCHNGMQLWREVCEQGYAGPRSRIWEVVQRLRQGLLAMMESPTTPTLRPRPPSPRQVVGIFLRRPTDRTAAEQQVLEQVIERCPDARVAHELTERFLALLRQRQAASLEAWLTDAAQCGLPEFQRLAAGLLTDHAAVVAAASLPYSNGQTEGQ